MNIQRQTLSTGQKLYGTEIRLKQGLRMNEKAAEQVKTIAKQTTSSATMSLDEANQLLRMSPQTRFHCPDKRQSQEREQL